MLQNLPKGYTQIETQLLILPMTPGDLRDSTDAHGRNVWLTVKLRQNQAFQP